MTQLQREALQKAINSGYCEEPLRPAIWHFLRKNGADVVNKKNWGPMTEFLTISKTLTP